MSLVVENWFYIAALVAFVAVHLVGATIGCRPDLNRHRKTPSAGGPVERTPDIRLWV